jgi:hypothetical protein
MVSNAATRGKVTSCLAGSSAGKSRGRWELQIRDRMENGLSHNTSLRIYTATFARLD